MIRFLERPAWRLETDTLRLTALECGGHVAEMVYKPGGDTNPLWIQNRKTIDSDQFDPEIHGSIYGTDAEARLISGLAGHNLCFPYWGSPSKAEERAGMTLHGETNILRWKHIESRDDFLKLGVVLPNSSIRFERTIRLAGQAVIFSETATDLSAWDRPVAWCEHVTLGPPFLAPGVTRFQASLTRGFRTGDARFAAFDWPRGHGQIACDLRTFSRTTHTDLVNGFLVDQSTDPAYFIAWNTDLQLLIGYIFRPAEFPWMNVWESNDDYRQTRGMEFSNTPVDGTMRKLIERPSIWGAPVYEWLDARKMLTKQYAAFLAIVPQNFEGIERVSIEDGEICLIEPAHGARVRLKFEGFDD